MWAISENHVDVAHLLVEVGADVHIPSSGHFTPMLFASRTGSIAIAESLSRAGASIDRVGEGPAPLVVAIDNARVEFARFLPGGDADAVVRRPPIVHRVLHFGRNRNAPVRRFSKFSCRFAITSGRYGMVPPSTIPRPPGADPIAPLSGSRPA